MEIEIQQSTINCMPIDSFESSHIPVLETTCSYSDFFQNHLLLNKPCIIKDIAKNWNSTKLWIKDDTPNIEYLRNKYGECDVTVYDCNEKYYNSQKTKQITFRDYLKYWINLKKSKAVQSYYLKDWHLKNQFPLDDFYEVPVYFASDWLNEYLCENCKDDYRFVYMGPKTTWTPFHQDVFCSYSWSVNVCGQKRWLLFPPGEEVNLKDLLGNMPYDITDISDDIKCFEVIQNEGEAIFVPAGWYHQVWNLKDTVSVNHNWINGCGIHKMWMSLKTNLEAVKNEIEDCRDMNNFVGHCQVVLKASYGLDFSEFYHFIKYIAVKRINFVDKNERITLFRAQTLGRNHALFDLNRIVSVLNLFLQHEDLRIISEICYSDAVKLLRDVETCLTKNL